MATNKKITTVRLSDRHRGILERLVAESGLSISAVVEQLLECTHTHQGDITLEKLLPVSSSSVKSDITNARSDITLKGAEADRVLFRSQPKYLSTGERVLWLDAWLWQVGKSPNGSQAVLTQLMEYPKVLFDGINGSEYQSSKEQVIEALANWNELKALEHMEAMGDRFFSDAGYFFNSRWFWRLKEDAKKAIAEYKASLQEATSALELVKDEMPLKLLQKLLPL